MRGVIFAQRKLATLLYFVAAGFIIFGLVTMYHYRSYNEEFNSSGGKAGHIVGGDAYNYIIIATRVVGLMIIGAVSAVVASALLIMEKLEDTRYSVEDVNKRLYSNNKDVLEKIGEVAQLTINKEA